MTISPPDEAARHEGDDLTTLKARIGQLSVVDVGALRDAWESLRDTARAAGERHTALGAESWIEALELPIPDWRDELSADEYAAALADELDAWGLDVDRSPAPMRSGPSEMPFALDATDESGTSWLFYLIDELPNPALELRVLAFLRAISEDERRERPRAVLLSRRSLPYGLAMWGSRSPDAQIVVSAAADTSMSVTDENVTDLLYFAEKHFGRPLDHDMASLDNLDAIASRLRDDGFGKVSYPWVCRIASYLGDVLENRVGTGYWVPANAPDDPFVLALADGRAVNLITLVRRYFESDGARPLSEMFEVVIDVLEDDE